MRRETVFLVALFLFTPGGHAYATPIAAGSSIGLQTFADAGAGQQSNSQNASQAGTTNDLSASSSITATNGNDFVTTTANGSVHFTDTGNLHVNLSNWGWNASTPSGSAEAGGGFGYDFFANGSKSLNVSFNTSETGTDFFGLQPFQLTLRDEITNSVDTTSMQLGKSGIISKSLNPTHEYLVQISSAPNIGGGLGTRSAYQSGTFDLSISASPALSAAPEPTSLTLLGGLGLGLAGYGWRRRKA